MFTVPLTLINSTSVAGSSHLHIFAAVKSHISFVVGGVVGTMSPSSIGGNCRRKTLEGNERQNMNFDFLRRMIVDQRFVTVFIVVYNVDHVVFELIGDVVFGAVATNVLINGAVDWRAVEWIDNVLEAVRLVDRNCRVDILFQHVDQRRIVWQ